MSKVVNIDKCFEKFSDTYSPKIVAELNGQNVMLVKAEGDKIPWHTHDNEDEMFLVLDGVLNILERDKTSIVRAGEFYIVPRGVEHRVVPDGAVKVMLFEPSQTAHLGKTKSEMTKDKFDYLDMN